MAGAVLLDAMGTLVRLDAPVPRLREALREHAGIEVDERNAAVALKAEVAFYRAHLHTAVDEPSLAALRARCAEAMRPHLPGAPAPAGLLAALLEAIRFAPFPEVPAALAALRAAGWRLVVASDWDVSLHPMLRDTGLAPLLHAAVSSVEAGAPKPDPAVFERALALAGARAEDSWHAGDGVAEDVAGARAAGVRPVLVDRDGGTAAPAGVPVVRGLDELPGVLGGPDPYA